jgi:hypothetical protein
VAEDTSLDAVAEKDERQILISVKWQQVSGTAEQKVPFEVICLVEASRAGRIIGPTCFLVEGLDLKGLLHLQWPREVFGLR